MEKPVIAIGGIDRTNIEDVLRTGVSSVAMISALSEAEDIVSEIEYFSEYFLK